MSTRVNLVAGRKTTGEAVYEEVLVTELADGNYGLDRTPGLVLGVAAGDCISADRANGEFSLLARGGNLAVQVYGPPDVALSVKDEVRKLGGRHDGGESGLTVYTIPVAAGFPAVEALLGSLSSKDPRIEWYFGNVYDEKDGVTPLDWWERSGVSCGSLTIGQFDEDSAHWGRRRPDVWSLRAGVLEGPHAVGWSLWESRRAAHRGTGGFRYLPRHGFAR